MLAKGDGSTLAIGPKAAWAEDTAHFVNMIEGGGIYGYRGIIALMREIREAFENEKDTRDIVPRKAVGLMSCCTVPRWRYMILPDAIQHTIHMMKCAGTTMKVLFLFQVFQK